MSTIEELLINLPNNEKIGSNGKNFKVDYKNGFKAFVKREGKHTYKLAVVDPQNPFQAFTLERREVKRFYDAVKKAYNNQLPIYLKAKNLTENEKKKWSLKELCPKSV